MHVVVVSGCMVLHDIYVFGVVKLIHVISVCNRHDVKHAVGHCM